MGRGAPLPGGQSTGSDAAEQALIALVRGASERARITDALRARSIEVIFVDRVAELTDAVMRTQRPIAAMVVEVRDADGRALHEVVGGLHAGGSGIPLVAYCRAGAEYSSDIRALVMAGAHQLRFHGINDAGVALRHVLDSANQASVGERAATELMRVVPKKLATFVSHVTRCPDTKQVADVAEALGYHRKTLVNHCTQADFIPPHELIDPHL